ncbi:universal stress protein [Natronolimnohabitans sp. A-GB9]|uniref:universal stress protein n=1 Tax=Natronolimnohabitans sp. A-GB9 TaxID=3069757 RepID=UPI0027B39238|nr:universal stress protein [Natronolimnohabitans sp. A-GB9]MDQ2049942.1 universal stress protein [Natronolimnohabitans sp. A-GB9]
MDDHEAVLEYALERARERDVSATGRIRSGRSVSSGVLAIAGDEDERVETILLGWRGRPRRRDVVLGGHIDEILADAPCDVLVERIDPDRPADVSSVLVPVAGGPNTDLAARVAGSIARIHTLASNCLLSFPITTRKASPTPASCLPRPRRNWVSSRRSSKQFSKARHKRRFSSEPATTT